MIITTEIKELEHIDIEEEIKYITFIMNDYIKYNILLDYGIKYTNFEYFTLYEINHNTIIKECLYIYYQHNKNENIYDILMSILYYFYIVTLIETLYENIFPIKNIKDILLFNIEKYKRVKYIYCKIIMDNSEYISIIRRKLLGLDILS